MLSVSSVSVRRRIGTVLLRRRIREMNSSGCMASVLSSSGSSQSTMTHPISARDSNVSSASSYRNDRITLQCWISSSCSAISWIRNPSSVSRVKSCDTIKIGHALFVIFMIHPFSKFFLRLISYGVNTVPAASSFSLSCSKISFPCCRGFPRRLIFSPPPVHPISFRSIGSSCRLHFPDLK
ncbi:hypothetical protein SDC9_161253 [bioreactor metagenome]|uniref:Uncharacterized protein n=1 Tax=bioreactor metagenome TaxID=1076179 RepID=A0A645FHU7_9ZZZZ